MTKSVNSKTSSQRIEPDFGFRIENWISGLQLTFLIKTWILMKLLTLPQYTQKIN